MTHEELNRRGIQVSQFLEQERFTDRGKNTCYPTSIINAAISLQTISTGDALRIHRTIIDRLIAVPDLWNGSLIHINTLDPRIAEIIEEYIPVEIGILEPSLGRLLTVPRSYQNIRRDLVTREAAHVVTVEEAFHAMAFVGFDEQARIGYIDPSDPFIKSYATVEWFNKTFGADEHGWVISTPVKRC